MCVYLCVDVCVCVFKFPSSYKDTSLPTRTTLIFDHLMQRADSLEKILMLGKIEGRGEGDDRG